MTGLHAAIRATCPVVMPSTVCPGQRRRRQVASLEGARLVELPFRIAAAPVLLRLGTIFLPP